MSSSIDFAIEGLLCSADFCDFCEPRTRADQLHEKRALYKVSTCIPSWVTVFMVEGFQFNPSYLSPAPFRPQTRKIPCPGRPPNFGDALLINSPGHEEGQLPDVGRCISSELPLIPRSIKSQTNNTELKILSVHAGSLSIHKPDLNSK